LCVSVGGTREGGASRHKSMENQEDISLLRLEFASVKVFVMHFKDTWQAHKVHTVKNQFLGESLLRIATGRKFLAAYMDREFMIWCQLDENTTLTDLGETPVLRISFTED
jgi:hypothetical protein